MIKLARPDWWKWQAKRLINIPIFWWRYANIQSFPDDCSSIDDVINFGRQHRILGFNRECIRAFIFWRLHQHYQCTSFVETGTYHGETTGYVRRTFKTPVFTSEIYPAHHMLSRLHLLWAGGIKFQRCNSPDFLRSVCRPEIIRHNPMFYLDAHWYDYIPLADELATIAERCDKAIVLIDDFFNPWDSRFLFDEYPGFRIDMHVVESAMVSRRKDVSVYLPKYDPTTDPTGKGIGFGVIVMGQDQELPEGSFPYNLLAKAPA